VNDPCNRIKFSAFDASFATWARSNSHNVDIGPAPRVVEGFISDLRYPPARYHPIRFRDRCKVQALGISQTKCTVLWLHQRSSTPICRVVVPPLACRWTFLLPSFPPNSLGGQHVPHAAGMPYHNPRLDGLAIIVAPIVTQGSPYLSMFSSEPSIPTTCTGRDSPLQLKIPPREPLKWSHNKPSCHSHE
jgi:hypothetical protein